MLVCEGLCVCVGQNATKWLCVRVCVPLAGTAVMSLGCSASASRTWERCLLMEPCKCNQSPAMCYWLILAIPNQHPIRVRFGCLYISRALHANFCQESHSFWLLQIWHFPQTHHITWLMILYSLDFTVKFQTDSVSKVLAASMKVLLSACAFIRFDKWASGMRCENEPGYVSPHKALHH